MKVWIICKTSKKYDTEKFSNLKNVKVIEPNRISIESIGNQVEILVDNEKIDYPNKCLFWLGCGTDEFMQIVNKVLIEKKVEIINDMDEILVFSNKYLTGLDLISKDILSIDMIKLNINTILEKVEYIEQKIGFPLVIKSDYGSMGKGIYLVNNSHDFTNIIENIMLLDSNFNFHLEKYMDYNHDVRMYIIYDEYYLFKRTNANSFKANFFQGANFSVHQTNEQFEKLFKAIKKNYKSKILAVDILVKNQEYYICEINSAPGFINFNRLLQVDFSQKILEKIDE